MNTAKCNEKSPAKARISYRSGNHFATPTFGMCPGILQANMAIMNEEVATDFALFCKRNSAPCPVIYQSQPGEAKAPLIAADSDIRTDLPAYNIWEKGILAKTTVNVLEYDWKKMVSFYLGCSFSFDDKLLEKGINLASNDKNVSMYSTNILCEPVGCFSTPMVVSMRAVPKSKLDDAFNATMNLDFCHGAPIHIGRPADIGITNLKVSDFGDYPVSLTEDEVPVFWACGVTSSMAIKEAKLDLSISHKPGGMYLADIKSDDVPKVIKCRSYPEAKIMCLSEPLERFSALSQQALQLLDEIGRDVRSSIQDYEITCLTLSKNASSISIIFDNLDDKGEALMCALYIVGAILGLKKRVTVSVSNQTYHTTVKNVFESIFQDHLLNGSLKIDLENTNDTSMFDHQIRIGNRNLSTESCLKDVGDLTTIHYDKVISNVITGLAVATGLFILRKCPVHDRFQRNGKGSPCELSFDDIVLQPTAIEKSFQKIKSIIVGGIDEVKSLHERYKEIALKI